MFPAFAWFRRRSDSPQHTLSESVELAFALARRTGQPIALGLSQSSRRGLQPRLAPGVRFGLPMGVPVPNGMLDPRWAERPRTLMVSPWRTATEGMWFFTDRKETLCMHLTARGSLRFLRYRKSCRSWQEV